MEDGEFKKGRWIPYPSPIEKFELVGIVKIEGLDEIEERIKRLKEDFDIINQASERYIHPNQQRLEV